MKIGKLNILFPGAPGVVYDGLSPMLFDTVEICEEYFNTDPVMRDENIYFHKCLTEEEFRNITYDELHRMSREEVKV